MIHLINVPIKNSPINIDFDILKNSKCNRIWDFHYYISRLIWNKHQVGFAANGVMGWNLFWVNSHPPKCRGYDCGSFADIFINYCQKHISSRKTQSIVWYSYKHPSSLVLLPPTFHFIQLPLQCSQLLNGICLGRFPKLQSRHFFFPAECESSQCRCKANCYWVEFLQRHKNGQPLRQILRFASRHRRGRVVIQSDPVFSHEKAPFSMEFLPFSNQIMAGLSRNQPYFKCASELLRR